MDAKCTSEMLVTIYQYTWSITSQKLLILKAGMLWLLWTLWCWELTIYNMQCDADKNKCQLIIPSRKCKVREAIQIAHLLQRKPGTNSATKGHGLIVFETDHKIYIIFRHFYA